MLTGDYFLAVEVLSWPGLATYSLLFFLELETRRDTPTGMTLHPTAERSFGAFGGRRE